MNARIAALKKQLALLEMKLASQLARPRPDDLKLMRLKMKKLRVKDELERLKGRLGQMDLSRMAG